MVENFEDVVKEGTIQETLLSPSKRANREKVNIELGGPQGYPSTMVAVQDMNNTLFQMNEYGDYCIAVTGIINSLNP